MSNQEAQFRVASELRKRFNTDPQLRFTRAILDPDRYGEQKIVVPENYAYSLGRVTISISQRWINALNPRRPAGYKFTDEEVAYRNSLREFLDFLGEVNDAINCGIITPAHVESWVTPWLRILAGPVRYINMTHYARRKELREKKEGKPAQGKTPAVEPVALTKDEQAEFNDHGIYHWYKRFENFIKRYNPGVIGLMKTFGIEFVDVPTVDWVRHINRKTQPGHVWIDRWAELNAMENTLDYPWDFLGITKDQRDSIFQAARDNIAIFRKDFVNK